MTKTSIWIAAVFWIFCTAAPTVQASVLHSKHQPCAASYMNWSDAARQLTEKQYPGAEFIDFLYVGCKTTSSTAIQHIYKFWVKQGSRTFGVYAVMTVNPISNQITSRSLTETDSTIPSFEKWKRIAEKAVLQQYRKARIIDCRPYDSHLLSAAAASQTYKCWIEQNQKPMILWVTIKYHLPSEEMERVEIRPESNRK